MRGDLRGIARARELSRAAMRNIRARPTALDVRPYLEPNNLPHVSPNAP